MLKDFNEKKIRIVTRATEYILWALIEKKNI